MARRYVVWTKEREQFVRDWYNDKVKISPSIIADKLGIRENMVLRKLSDWGLRKRTGNKDV